MIRREKIMSKDVLRLEDGARYWFFRAGSEAIYVDDFYNNNYIAIGNDEITLEDAYSLDEKVFSTDESLKDAYKQMYQRKLIDSLKETDIYKDANTDTKEKLVSKKRRSASIASSAGFKFINQMQTGDIVLLPRKASNSFVLGFVSSDSFSGNMTHINIDPEHPYKICPFIKKRRVTWVKNITMSELPDKLMWIKNGRRAIFDITESAASINPLLSNRYIFQGNYYERVGVAATYKIPAIDFFNLQSAIQESMPKEQNETVYQTINVQSPGDVILHTVVPNWHLILGTCALLFGDFEVSTGNQKIRIQGIARYFTPTNIDIRKAARAEAQLSAVRAQKKMDALNAHGDLDEQLKEEELKMKRIQRKKEELSLENEEKLKEINSETVEVAVISGNNIVPISSQQQSSLNDLQINQREIGSVIPNQTKTETYSRNED